MYRRLIAAFADPESGAGFAHTPIRRIGDRQTAIAAIIGSDRSLPLDAKVKAVFIFIALGCSSCREEHGGAACQE